MNRGYPLKKAGTSPGAPRGMPGVRREKPGVPRVFPLGLPRGGGAHGERVASIFRHVYFCCLI
jgi:hypothetical protein